MRCSTPHLSSAALMFYVRFVQGTPPTLILNATIWTGGRNGTEVVFGDLLLDKGLVQAVGYIPPAMRAKLEDDAVIVNADGAWVTPGLFDMHSHIGVGSAPLLRGQSFFTLPACPTADEPFVGNCAFYQETSIGAHQKDLYNHGIVA